MVSFTRSFLGCLLLGAAVTSGTVQAQTFVQSEKSETLIQREMDAFLDPDITTIPQEGRSLFRDTKEQRLNEFEIGKTYPIETNPVLANKIGASKAFAPDGLNVDAEINSGWGTIVSTDTELQYLYTQEDEKSFNFGATNYYRSSTFKIYDENFDVIKSFTVNSNDTTMFFRLVNASSKILNNDSKWEFSVSVHGFSGGEISPATIKDTVIIVNEDSEVLKRVPNTTYVAFNKVKVGSAQKYQMQVFDNYYPSLGHTAQICRFYDPKKLGGVDESMPESLFTYSVENKYLTYSYGPTFSLYNIDGTDYYVASRYEKPFVANDDQMNPEYEMNNKFLISFYNTSFEIVKEISLPLIGQDKHELSMSSLGDFSDYMFTSKVFNDDDKLEMIYGMSRYYVDCDCERVDYYLINEDGEILKELEKEVAGVIALQDIPGYSKQYALLQGASDAVTGFIMYDMPEMKRQTVFPAFHNGNLLSLSFERIASDNSYEYVFGLGQGESGNNTVYGRIAHYDNTGKMKKIVKIDLGQSAARFNPIIMASTLNPYTFIADDKIEYLYFANNYADNSSITSKFGIANDEKVLYTWEDDVDNNEFVGGAGIMTDSKRSYVKNLYVTKSTSADIVIGSTFYSLPLQDIQLQGDGTENNPYIITSPSELDYIRKYADSYAFFKLGCDIDMASFAGVAGKGFNPIPNFNGVFDGDNHVISNLVINASESNSGLFATVSGTAACVKNLQIENVEFKNLGSSYFGAIAGRLTGGAKISNCHVSFNIENNEISLTRFGGLVGEMTLNSVVTSSSFTGDILLKKSSYVGGIAGKQMSGSVISNSFSEGSVYANSTVGGISGTAFNSIQVVNCYSNMNVSGVSQIGGLVGVNGGTVEYCYATGSVEVDVRPEEKWFKSAGGLAGNLSMGQCLVYLKNSIALNDKVVMNTEYGRVAYTPTLENANKSIVFENNYALSSMLIGPDSENLATVDESDETTVGLDKIHGKSVTKEELNQAFYEALGWSFGTDSVSPWVMTDEYPRLWHEFVVRGVKLDVNELTIAKGEKYTLKPEIFPADATNKNVRYASSDMKVASVSATGEITARGTGEADITVTTEEGSYKAVCHVTVVIPVEQVIITQEEVKVGVREYVELEAQVLPEDATNKKVVWMTENSGIAYMIENNVVGVTPGVTNVIAMTEDGEVSDTCVVTVVAPVEDLYLEETMISLDKQNPTHQLVARLVPETADATLVWETEDAGIAEVDQNGLVTGHRKGEIIVTVSTDDHLFSAECLVEVTEDIDISVDMNAIECTRVFAEEGSIVVLSEAEVTGVQVSDAAGTLVYADFATEGSRIVVPSAEWTSGAYIVKVLFGNGDSRVYKVVL